MKSLSFAPLALLLLASAQLSSAASLVLAPSQDNTIYSENSTLSNGKGVNFFAGNNGNGTTGDPRRALIAFDLSAIPAGATIDSVSLQLFATVATPTSGTQTVSLYRLIRLTPDSGWGEGTSNAGSPGGGRHVSPWG
jgi:hypothetical protein